MFRKLINKVIGDPNDKIIKALQPIVDEVASYEPDIKKLSDEELRNESLKLKERLANGETLDDILPYAFALVREAAWRNIGMRHYDVQIMGGVLLHRGDVVEMRTGEGKTLVATLPLYLNALSGKGAHLVTVNEYLARRDGGWMGKVYHALGLTVGVIGPQQYSALFDPDYVNPGADLEDERLVHWRPCTRRQAYEADITYGISSEFGFDYLRDNMATRPDRLVQRDLHFAVIDEVDNVLIDEARTPLIISGPAQQSGDDYKRFAQYVRGLRKNTAEEDEEPNGHYDIDEKSRTISLTELGIAEIEKRIEEINPDAGDSLYDPRFFHLTYYLDNALKAQYLYKRDVHYVVQNGEVLIVDDFTGRLMPGRRYSDGLHEAIEAKEGVQVKRETITVATITLQNYFRLYEKLAGMTGTALTDAEEFDKIYELGVTPLPTNVEYIVRKGELGLIEKQEKVEGTTAVYYVDPKTEKPVFFKRVDYPDQVYGTETGKDKAIVAEIKRIHEMGRPVLVGTTSVEHSEIIHDMLRREGIAHNVLNAKRHQAEALVVAQAGRKGAVTISTNMAGRGTDILLGGNPEGLASELLEERLFERQSLVQLAATLLEESENAARNQAKRHPKLDEALVDALLEIKQQFDDALAQIQKLQLTGFLVQVLQEPYGMTSGDLMQIVRLVRAGRSHQARMTLDEQGRDIGLVDEINRLTNLYGRYESIHKKTKETAEFIADQLFERHYNARAALIRAVLAGDKEEAQKVCTAVPALPAKLIDEIEALQEQAKKERQEVWELGGLHVIGSERHESRRIDNQLRGRAARQGDPGSSRFFLSLEDDLMKRFGGERLKNFMARTNIPEDMPIESAMLERLIESSQERIEGYNFDIRKNVVEYDDVMNKQRQAIYTERRAILLGQDVDLDEKIDAAFAKTIEELVDNYVENYRDFTRSEINRAIQDYTTEATDVTNVPAVINRLRGLLPQVVKLDRDELAEMSSDAMAEQFMRLAYENEEQGYNLVQLLMALSRFIPVLPSIPNLASLLKEKSRTQIKEKVRYDYLQQVKTLFDELLADYVEQEQQEILWQEASDRISHAFTQFNLQTLSPKTAVQQQNRFRAEVDDALRQLLLDSISTLDSDQLIAALNEYVNKQQKKWREAIGEEEYRNFQRVLLLDSIDREWRDYLTAMDDLRREIGLEAVGQRDPKVQYKIRSAEMFADMRSNIDKNIAERYFFQIAAHQQFIRQQQQEVAYQLQGVNQQPANSNNAASTSRKRRIGGKKGGSSKKSSAAGSRRKSFKKGRRK
jgi:preprotein translocase subunit SecA